MKRMFVLFLLFSVWTVAVPAFAAEATVPPVLQKLKDEGMTVDFMGHAYGTDGWRVTDKTGGDPKYAYTTPEGGVLLGILLRPDGISETNEQLKALKGKLDGAQEALPGADKAIAPDARVERFYAEVEKSGWGATGDTMAPYLYLFVNMLCAPCQALWKELEPQVKSGKIQVRIVPFGKVQENRESGAALLSADDPAAAWNAHIRGEAGALGKDKIKPGALEKVDANTNLFRDWSMQGPPFIVYRRPSDAQVTVIAGKPDNLMLLLADLMKEKAP